MCASFHCGDCDDNGRCYEDTGYGDFFHPDDPGSPSGGGGQAGNGKGPNESSGSCPGDLDDTAASGTCPVKTPIRGTKVTVKVKAQCGAACDTQFASSCGAGCGCTFAGTGALGGLDGECHALAFFGTQSDEYSEPP